MPAKNRPARATRAEFARIIGRPKPFITKMVKRGVLKLGSDNRLDVAESEKSLADNLDPAQMHSVANTAKNSAKNGDQPSFLQARTDRERIKARREQMEFEKMAGSLVPLDQVKVTAFNTGRVLRDTLLNIADRIAPVVAAESDAKKCHDIIANEIRIVLEELQRPHAFG